jgi:hypothetical protein
VTKREFSCEPDVAAFLRTACLIHRVNSCMLELLHRTYSTSCPMMNGQISPEASLSQVNNLAEKVATIFYDYSSMFKLYSTYATLFDQVNVLLQTYAPRRNMEEDDDPYLAWWNNLFKLKSLSKEDFVSLLPFLEEARKDVRLKGQIFASFLIMPIQRVPRYVLLLKELSKKAKYDKELNMAVQDAISSVEKIAAFINRTIAKHESEMKVVRMIGSLATDEKSSELAESMYDERVHHILLTMYSGINVLDLMHDPISCDLYLFDDCLIIIVPIAHQSTMRKVLLKLSINSFNLTFESEEAVITIKVTNASEWSFGSASFRLDFNGLDDSNRFVQVCTERQFTTSDQASHAALEKTQGNSSVCQACSSTTNPEDLFHCKKCDCIVCAACGQSKASVCKKCLELVDGDVKVPSEFQMKERRSLAANVSKYFQLDRFQIGHIKFFQPVPLNEDCYQKRPQGNSGQVLECTKCHNKGRVFPNCAFCGLSCCEKCCGDSLTLSNLFDQSNKSIKKTYLCCVDCVPQAIVDRSQEEMKRTLKEEDFHLFDLLVEEMFSSKKQGNVFIEESPSSNLFF